MRIFWALLVLLFSFSAWGQAYPSKPIRLLIPYAAGGPTDVLARVIAPKLSESLGQPVIAENRLGAGGGVAMDAVAKAPPDGYLIGIGLTGTNSINPHLYAKLPYDPLKDFAPVTPIVSYVNVLIVGPGVQAKNVAELVGQAKAAPGGMAYASGGKGASNHLSGELLRVIAGAPLLHVPYKGNGPALVDVMSGNVAFMFDILGSALPQIRSGKVRALAVTSAKRSEFAPEIPTMRESGVVGYDEAGSDLWMGVFAPAGTPKAVVDRLNAEIVKAMRSLEVAERVKGYAYEVWTLSPEDFAVHLRTDNAKWGRVVKQAGITPE